MMANTNENRDGVREAVKKSSSDDEGEGGRSRQNERTGEQHRHRTCQRDRVRHPRDVGTDEEEIELPEGACKNKRYRFRPGYDRICGCCGGIIFGEIITPGGIGDRWRRRDPDDDIREERCSRHRENEEVESSNDERRVGRRRYLERRRNRDDSDEDEDVANARRERDRTAPIVRRRFRRDGKLRSMTISFSYF